MRQTINEARNSQDEHHEWRTMADLSIYLFCRSCCIVDTVDGQNYQKGRPAVPCTRKKNCSGSSGSGVSTFGSSSSLVHQLPKTKILLTSSLYFGLVLSLLSWEWCQPSHRQASLEWARIRVDFRVVGLIGLDRSLVSFPWKCSESHSVGYSQGFPELKLSTLG